MVLEGRVLCSLCLYIVVSITFSTSVPPPTYIRVLRVFLFFNMYFLQAFSGVPPAVLQSTP